MPPRLGKLDSKAFGAKYAREILGYKSESWTLKKAQIVNLNHEIDDDLGDYLLPRTMHPAIPAYITCTVMACPESPVGPYAIGEVKVAGRAGVRPRDFVLRTYCNNEQARRELAQRWGYPTTAGEVKLIARHDRIIGQVSAEGRTVLEFEMLDRELLSGNDIQYIASMHLARNKDDGQLVLVQVDPEFTFSRAERGRPILRGLDSAAWGDTEGHLKLRNPISVSYGIADVAMPKIRYICDPERPAFQGTTQVAA
jgi:Acetoacetate decarboxylase (ADC)